MPVIIPSSCPATMVLTTTKSACVTSAFCNYNSEMSPEIEDDGRPDHLRWAQIVAFITDAIGNTYTYAGVIQYGVGGAFMFPVRDPAALAIAYTGEDPREIKDQPMTHMSQFVCGMIAHLISYYDKEGGIYFGTDVADEDAQITAEGSN